MAPEVRDFLDNPPPEFVSLQFNIVLEKFVRNYLVTASFAGTSHKTIAFERLRDVDEVWVMCVRKPNVGQWRFFGRFVAPGLFVILTQKSRIECGTKEQYAACIDEFLDRWLAVFGNHECLRANNCEGCFGEMVSDYDAE